MWGYGRFSPRVKGVTGDVQGLGSRVPSLEGYVGLYWDSVGFRDIYGESNGKGHVT